MRAAVICKEWEAKESKQRHDIFLILYLKNYELTIISHENNNTVNFHTYSYNKKQQYNNT